MLAYHGDALNAADADFHQNWNELANANWPFEYK